MENPHLPDRRFFERFKVNLNLVCVPKEPAGQREINAFDISAQGIGLISDTDLTPGAQMDFALRIPPLNKEFLTHGTVIWTKKVNARFRSGIQLDPSQLMGVSTVLRMLHSLPV